MRRAQALGLVIGASGLLASACQSEAPKPEPEPWTQYEDRGLSPETPVQVEERPGVLVEDLRLGQGMQLRVGARLYLHFTLWSSPKIRKLDSSIDRGPYLEYIYGRHSVCPGFDRGLAGMRVGGLRRLRIDAAQGFGASGAGPVPPNTDLIYEVRLLQITEP